MKNRSSTLMIAGVCIILFGLFLAFGGGCTAVQGQDVEPTPQAMPGKGIPGDGAIYPLEQEGTEGYNWGYALVKTVYGEPDGTVTGDEWEAFYMDAPPRHEAVFAQDGLLVIEVPFGTDPQLHDAYITCARFGWSYWDTRCLSAAVATATPTPTMTAVPTATPVLTGEYHLAYDCYEKPDEWASCIGYVRSKEPFPHGTVVTVCMPNDRIGGYSTYIIGSNQTIGVGFGAMGRNLTMNVTGRVVLPNGAVWEDSQEFAANPNMDDAVPAENPPSCTLDNPNLSAATTGGSDAVIKLETQ